MKVLSQQQLNRVNKENYVYVAHGSTLLEPYLKVYWTWIFKYVPRWIAPITITVLGLIINLISTLMIMYYSAAEETPRWIYIWNAISFFIYQTLDSLDGKQAIILGDNVLVELADHGCDAISAVVASIACACSMLLHQSPHLMFVVCMSSIILFYCGHWASYVTGSLQYGKIDVCEVQISTMIIFLISGVFGPEIWDSRIPLLTIPLKGIPIIFMFVGVFAALLRFIGRIAKGRCGQSRTAVAGQSVLSPFFNIAIVFIFSLVISMKSDMMLLENHPVLYIMFFGIVGAKATNRILVAHLTHSELSLLDTSLLVPLLLFLNQYFNSVTNEYLLLWICMIYAAIDILVYLAIVYQQLASYLEISIFFVPPEQHNEVKRK